MLNPLLAILRAGNVAFRDVCPELPAEAEGLPTVTSATCEGESCGICVDACPTVAIAVVGKAVALDRGRCIGCSACLRVCPTGTLANDRSTLTAVRTREELILGDRGAALQAGWAGPVAEEGKPRADFRRSLHVREVSTGDGASDVEANAACNSQFDVARFGVQFVASPRHADALLVSGPVGKAMQEPLRRCYDAMAEPRLVIALGTAAISGGLFAGGYAEAGGVGSVLPVDCFVPGDPPHPWSIVHGLLLAMGRVG